MKKRAPTKTDYAQALALIIDYYVPMQSRDTTERDIERLRQAVVKDPKYTGGFGLLADGLERALNSRTAC